MINYKAAGVDTEKAQGLIQNLKKDISATHRVPGVGEVVGKFGGFAGQFTSILPMQDYDIVAATDGVGTKIQLLKKFNFLTGIGDDLVAMCVNDLFCAGGVPAFFLDYIACGKLSDSWYNPVIQSITAACQSVPMALLGGETAEHPGVMSVDDFDLAGFAVGFVPKKKSLPLFEMQNVGDVVVALPSSGLHSNGFSLVRKILSMLENEQPSEYEKLTANRESFLSAWLAPTRIYREIPKLLQVAEISALCHVTGGGIFENLPRVLRDDLAAHIEIPEPFSLSVAPVLKQFVAARDLHHTFNMGTGMFAICRESEFKHICTVYPEAKITGKLVKATGERVILSL